MMNQQHGNSHSFYLAYALSAAIFAASLVLSNTMLLALSSIILIASIALLNSGHLISNLLIKKSSVIIVSGNYAIARSLGSISRKDGDGFTSISMALLKPRQGTAFKSTALKDLLDGISEHFEFSLELEEADKSRMIENLRTKMRMKEIALSRIGERHRDKANLLRRQIDLLNDDISGLASSGKSFQFAIKLKSICSSPDRDEAESASYKHIGILANKFSAALGVDHEVLTGETLLHASGV
jgi:hypothetical protein